MCQSVYIAWYDMYQSVCILTWQVTASVWQICVFPVRNSPNISVILPVSIPPPSSLSNS